MSRILVVSEDTTVARRLEISDREEAFEVQQTAWSDWDVQTLFQPVADAVLIDYRHPDDIPGRITHRLTKELRQREPEVPVVFVTDIAAAHREAIQAAIGTRQVAFTDSQVFTRAGFLAAMHDLGKTDTGFQKTFAAKQSFPHLVPKLRNPKSGRLDARRVSELFAIPLNRLAGAMDAEPAAVYKTADAAGLQDTLRLYERIARVLLRLVGSEEGLRIWLNTPEPDLDGEIPRDLLLNGEGDVVADLLEDMQEGQPS
jgi:CheY-like chemotaxis protein